MIRPPYTWRDRLFKMAWPLLLLDGSSLNRFGSGARPQLFSFFYHRSLSTCSSEKKGGKKISKNKKKGFFFSIDFEVFRSSFIAFIVSIVSFLHCSSIYNARRWIDVCMCIMYVLCGCFLVLLHYWFSKSRRRMEE